MLNGESCLCLPSQSPLDLHPLQLVGQVLSLSSLGLSNIDKPDTFSSKFAAQQ